MIYLKHGENPVAVPTMWSELKLSQWIDLQKAGKDQVKIVAVLTGLHINVVKRLSKRSLSLIANATTFIGTKLNVSTWIVPKVLKLGEYTVNPSIDIKEKEYGQKIVLTDAVVSKVELIHNLSTICEVYLQCLITKKSYDPEKTEEIKSLIDKGITLCDAYAIAMDYQQQLKELLDNERETLSKPPTADQQRAGINMYNNFGIMNTIRALAGGDILKVDEVLRKDYNTVYLWLLMNKTDAVFSEQYSDVISKKINKGN